jgi:phenylacetate-CoA ligase
MAALVERLGRSERWPAQRLHANQLAQLRALLVHALTHSPLHRERLDLAPDAAARIDWPAWRRLPTLTRATLQRHVNRLVVQALPEGHGKLHWTATTGSTGDPLRLAVTQLCHFQYGALTLREHLWHRRDPGARLAVARASAREGDFPNWGAPVAELYRTGPLRVLDVKRALAEQFRRIAAFDPHYLLTYASNAYALAEHAAAHDARLPSLREVRVFGELPRPDLAETLQRAFGATCADVYSAEEVGPIAAQCAEHGNYHVHAEAVLLEILDAHGEACPPGRIGRVVITPLHNFATPLLRYELGDFAAFGEPCACGRGLPVLSRIAGRRRNMLVLPDGSRHWPSFPGSVWLAFPAIRRVQLVQTALDTVEVRMESDRDLDAAERERLCRSVRERLVWPHGLRLCRVDSIRAAGSHKLEDFMSLVEPPA